MRIITAPGSLDYMSDVATELAGGDFRSAVFFDKLQVPEADLGVSYIAVQLHVVDRAVLANSTDEDSVVRVLVALAAARTAHLVNELSMMGYTPWVSKR